MSAKKDFEKLSVDRQKRVQSLVDAMETQRDFAQKGPPTREEQDKYKSADKLVKDAQKAEADLKIDRQVAKAEKDAGKDHTKGFSMLARMSPEERAKADESRLARFPEAGRPENKDMFAAGRMNLGQAMERSGQIKTEEDFKMAKGLVAERAAEEKAATQVAAHKPAHHAPKPQHKPAEPAHKAEATHTASKAAHDNGKHAEVKVEDFAKNPNLAHLAAKGPQSSTTQKATAVAADAQGERKVDGVNVRAAPTTQAAATQDQNNYLNRSEPIRLGVKGAGLPPLDKAVTTAPVHTSRAQGTDLPPLDQSVTTSPVRMASVQGTDLPPLDKSVVSAPVRMAEVQGQALPPLDASARNSASSVDSAVAAARSFSKENVSEGAAHASRAPTPSASASGAQNSGEMKTQAAATPSAQVTQGPQSASAQTNDQGKVKDALMQGAHPSEANKASDMLGKESPTASATPRFDQATYGRALQFLNENASRENASQATAPAQDRQANTQQAQQQVQQQDQKQQQSQKQQVREMEHSAE